MFSDDDDVMSVHPILLSSTGLLDQANFTTIEFQHL